MSQGNIAELRDEHPFLSEKWATKNTRIEFNLVTGEHKQEVFGPEVATEFPNVNQNCIGYKSKFIYLPYLEESMPESKAARDNISALGFYKFNTELRKVVAKIDFG